MSVLRNEKTRRVALMGLLFALSVVLSFLEGYAHAAVGAAAWREAGSCKCGCDVCAVLSGARQRVHACSAQKLFCIAHPRCDGRRAEPRRGLLSLGVMAVLCLFRSRPSVFILSVCGAITHNFWAAAGHQSADDPICLYIVLCACPAAFGPWDGGADVGGAEGAFAGAGKAWFPKVSKIIDIFYQ